MSDLGHLPNYSEGWGNGKNRSKYLGCVGTDAPYLSPEYAAADKLLFPSIRHPGRGAYITRGDQKGHVWDVEEMNNFISRLRDPSLSEYANIANVSQFVSDPLKSDDSLAHEMTVQDSDIDKEKLNRLRNKRKGLILGMCIMYSSIPGFKETYKSPWVYDADEIFNDRLTAQSEQRVLEEFSYNDFSYSTFLDLVKRSYDPIMKNDKVASTLKEHLVKDFMRYTSVLSVFQSHESW